MKRLALLALTLALCAATAFFAAPAKASFSSTIYLSGGRECTLVIDEPTLNYYAPWNQWYIASDVYANCKVWAGSFYLPYQVEAIDVWSTLRKCSGRSCGSFLIIDDAESHVYDKSLTSTSLTYNCVVATSWNYKTAADVTFKLYNDPNQYTIALNTPWFLLGCS